jgi:rubrerythrin
VSAGRACETRRRVLDPDTGRQRFARADEGPRWKPKVRITSPGQMARLRGRSNLQAFVCPECGYVHLGNPKGVAS